MIEFDENYFLNAEPKILDNDSLRQAQMEAYVEICKHFLIENSQQHAVVVLPTGAGKTGVIATAPFGISNGRVLIITPQLVIKDHVLDSLDSSLPGNFWLKYGIFDEFNDLPQIVEYDNDIQDEELINSNIVILNIHKLSNKYKKSLLTKVEPYFFDMIIIDEAHHSPADTWQQALDYFETAKVIKVTGTPFRTDRKPIEGKLIVNYRLGKAMNEGIVKTLKNFRLIPEKIFLTIDDNEDKKYTISELEALQIKDRNYISRSVALSRECNEQIVQASLDELEKRLSESNVPHKIIAVCCSIKHAEKVKELYIESGKRVVIVHSDLDKKERKEELRKIESHQTDVVIHVAMLGEGYDHPYLSVAAIFRPFRSLAPYSQFIGRILRRIPDSEAESQLDNIGVVIAHKELDLDDLWNEYQEEQKYNEILESVKRSEKIEKKLDKDLKRERNTDVAEVSVEGELLTDEEYYEYTKAAEKYEQYQRELQQKIKQLKEVFPERSEKDLLKLAKKEAKPSNISPLLKNPKKYRSILRNEFDQAVKIEIPATLLSEFSLNKEGEQLLKLRVKPSLRWVFNNNPDNAAIIAKYLNGYFNERYGQRNNWTIKDYENATSDLFAIVNHLRKMIKSII